jgi:integrase
MTRAGIEHGSMFLALQMSAQICSVVVSSTSASSLRLETSALQHRIRAQPPNYRPPRRLLEELKGYRKEHAELCLGLGLGKVDLVFPHWPDGTLRNPSHFSKAFSREVAAAKLPHVTFHRLRHTHVTHLLRSGVPVHVVSARAGHANPTVTLNIYAHLLPGQQEGAAAIIDAALREALSEQLRYQSGTN